MSIEKLLQQSGGVKLDLASLFGSAVSGINKDSSSGNDQISKQFDIPFSSPTTTTTTTTTTTVRPTGNLKKVLHNFKTLKIVEFQNLVFANPNVIWREQFALLME